MRQFSRADRLSEQILKDISLVWDREIADKVSGMVTFTRVSLTKDLRYATVYYSYLGNADGRQAIADCLVRENKVLRQLVGQGLHIRHIPEFRFKFDPSIEEGIRIEKLLNDIQTSTND